MKQEGASTIEATISFSIFILLCIFFINIISAIGFHQEIKSEADRIALEIAKLTYIPYILEPIINESDIGIPDEFANVINYLGNEIALNLVINEMIDKKYTDRIDSAWGHFILTEEGKEVQIYIEYKLSLPIIDEKKQMKITSVTRCWEGGDQGFDSYIWSLPPVLRGRRFEKIFKCNLPFNYPILDYFNPVSGIGIMQTSIDTTRSYYLNSNNLEKRIAACIKQLSDFNGAKKGDTNITSSDILIKKLKIIIPENDLTEEQISILNKLKNDSIGYGIQFEIIKYGIKREPEDTDSLE